MYVVSLSVVVVLAEQEAGLKKVQTHVPAVDSNLPLTTTKKAVEVGAGENTESFDFLVELGRIHIHIRFRCHCRFRTSEKVEVGV